MNEKPFQADLHCHSTASDGSDSPEKLIDLAIKIGLSALAISDHDTINAYQTAAPYAKEKGLLLLPALELSTVYGDESVHILAYGFSLTSELIHDLCQGQEKRREERNRLILEKIQKAGITIDESDLESFTGNKGRPHIATILLKKKVVSTFKEAFDHYLGEGKLFYAAGNRMQVVDAIASIQQAGGKAILAHPHLIKERKILRDLLAMPFDGLEGYYAIMPKHKCLEFVHIALQKGWIVTGGSDYHGSIKPQIALGASWTPKESFDKLYEHYLHSSR